MTQGAGTSAVSVLKARRWRGFAFSKVVEPSWLRDAVMAESVDKICKNLETYFSEQRHSKICWRFMVEEFNLRST